MEREEGMVIEAKENIAKIKAAKHGECKSCGACPGNDSAIVTAKNEVGAVPGQRVIFEMNETNSLKGAFVVFVLPLIAVFLGAVFGGILVGLAGYPEAPGRVFGGIVAFAAAAAFIKIFDHYVGKKEKSLPVIIRIL
ncbi:MAG: positive regulator of sigma RseC/MucC [Bacillota bacterium]|jgi:sigma-E factor negative regulatory protein RseC|nr:positive regulator of sigma RseC/MucC [Bacillota bacterium]